MLRKILIIIFYLISLLFLIIYITNELLPNSFPSELGRIVLLSLTSFFTFLGSFFLSIQLNNSKPMRITLWFFFILYISLLLTLTLFNPSWGRYGIDLYNISTKNYNIIPFKTIIDYINLVHNSYLNSNAIVNLFGNIIAFMPMAFFLPILFRKERKFKNFLITMILVILCIELTQLITSTGRCDIDDFILNLLGSVLMYLFIRIEAIEKLIDCIFLQNSK